MDLQQTWAQVQALPIADQWKLLEYLQNTLPPELVRQALVNTELISELECRVEYDIAHPEGGCTFEEFWAERAAKK